MSCAFEKLVVGSVLASKVPNLPETLMIPRVPLLFVGILGRKIGTCISK
jgi:hypothetical protein